MFDTAVSARKEYETFIRIKKFEQEQKNREEDGALDMPISSTIFTRSVKSSKRKEKIKKAKIKGKKSVATVILTEDDRKQIRNYALGITSDAEWEALAQIGNMNQDMYRAGVNEKNYYLQHGKMSGRFTQKTDSGTDIGVLRDVKNFNEKEKRQIDRFLIGSISELEWSDMYNDGTIPEDVFSAGIDRRLEKSTDKSTAIVKYKGDTESDETNELIERFSLGYIDDAEWDNMQARGTITRGTYFDGIAEKNYYIIYGFLSGKYSVSVKNKSYDTELQTKRSQDKKKKVEEEEAFDTIDKDFIIRYAMGLYSDEDWSLLAVDGVISSEVLQAGVNEQTFFIERGELSGRYDSNEFSQLDINDIEDFIHKEIDEDEWYRMFVEDEIMAHVYLSGMEELDYAETHGVPSTRFEKLTNRKKEGKIGGKKPASFKHMYDMEEPPKLSFKEELMLEDIRNGEISESDWVHMYTNREVSKAAYNVGTYIFSNKTQPPQSLSRKTLYSAGYNPRLYVLG